MNLNNIIELININKGKYNLKFYLIGGAVRDLLTGNEMTVKYLGSTTHTQAGYSAADGTSRALDA